MSNKLGDVFVRQHLIGFVAAAMTSTLFFGPVNAYANNPVDLDRGRLLVCRSGADRCLDTIVRQMTKRYRGLGCDHNSAFALMYLRTTESVRDAARLGEFRDRQWINIFAWREVAWRNAERLAAAPNHKARRLIAAEIEENAASMARAIVAAFPADDSFNQFRDAYCAARQ
ncbi:MAG TPA: DUF5995 family protein [Burkholderiales bacterium]|nr:DUF5995 family protein [Burkholderiales bacterium]